MAALDPVPSALVSTDVEGTMVVVTATVDDDPAGAEVGAGVVGAADVVGPDVVAGTVGAARLPGPWPLSSSESVGCRRRSPARADRDLGHRAAPRRAFHRLVLRAAARGRAAPGLPGRVAVDPHQLLAVGADLYRREGQETPDFVRCDERDEEGSLLVRRQRPTPVHSTPGCGAVRCAVRRPTLDLSAAASGRRMRTATVSDSPQP